MSRRRTRIAPAAYALLLLVPACGTPGCGGATPETPAAAAAAPAPSIRRESFVDVTSETGLDFRHFNGMSGEYYILEHMGSGVGLLDYDGDGDLDVYLVQGNMLGPGKAAEDATLPPPDALPLRDRLWRNDLEVAEDGTRRMRFIDVTTESRIVARGYGMGVATGDYDNDGHVDLYVTNWGPNQLWRNVGDGTFEDVTARAGVDDPRWSTSAAFVDYDADGWLDLYVANYLDFDYSRHVRCERPSGGPDYCGPQAYNGQPDRLLRNLGDGRFADATAASGVGAAAGKGLGVVAADFDGDGRIDVYVANDEVENLLWINRGDGTFHERALFAGCALNRQGRPEAGMGVDAADFDADGDEDLFMVHLARETNTIYVNEGGTFTDQSAATGLGPPSWNDTGFGTAWLDHDNDGWLDVLVANGAATVIEERALAGDPHPLGQPNRLFRNRGDGRFEAVPGGAALDRDEVSRGAAFGDVDNDGDTDVVIANNAGPARVLSNTANDVAEPHHWIGLRLVGARAPRDMLGARVELVREGRPSLWRRARSDGSYCSAHDPRVLFGLGPTPAVALVRVHWPDGTTDEWTDLPIDRYATLRQGAGRDGTAR